MKPKSLLLSLTLPLMLSVGAAWGSSNLDWFAYSLAPQVSEFVPNPKDVAFYYPLPQVVPISSPFGWRIHPLYGNRRLHAGIDLAAPAGMAVLAAHSGWVRYAGWQEGYGNTVVLEYADGQYQTLYGHLAEILVAAGAAVRPRQVIGRVGSTGGSTGPHLHFELRKKTGGTWLAVNPYSQVRSVEAYVAARPEAFEFEPAKALPPNQPSHDDDTGLAFALDFTPP